MDATGISSNILKALPANILPTELLSNTLRAEEAPQMKN
jgi:hypothetical protein